MTPPTGLGDWIERWAQQDPDRIALVLADEGRRLTYRGLDREIRQAQRWLDDVMDIKRGDRIAVLDRNRREHVVLFFACARLGAVLVPLNWRLAGPEQLEILADAAPALLVRGVGPGPGPVRGGGDGPAAREAILAPPGGPTPWDEQDEGPAGEEPTPCGADDPVLILYTSGTTGQPKGAVLTHGSISWNSINTSISWDLSGSDVTLTHTPVFHTGGWNVLTLPLLHRGGRVVLTEKFDPDRALELVDTQSLTLLFAVPTMYEMMIASPRFETTSFESLRFAISGGAPCPPAVSERFAGRGVRFKQGYGLTEVGPNCFTISLDEAARRPDSVGHPIHHERIRIVNEAGADCAPGEVGELLLAGPHVFGGYWNQPEATAGALRDGWFHTGDLARRDVEGFTSIVGRRKEMFISGGENVYPAEVERVILAHPGVRQVAVIGIPDPTWGEVGRAFVVPHKGLAADAETLRSFCLERLARYKVPKRFDLVEELPLTSSGKIAKAVLRDVPA